MFALQSYLTFTTNRGVATFTHGRTCVPEKVENKFMISNQNASMIPKKQLTKNFTT